MIEKADGLPEINAVFSRSSVFTERASQTLVYTLTDSMSATEKEIGLCLPELDQHGILGAIIIAKLTNSLVLETKAVNNSI